MMAGMLAFEWIEKMRAPSPVRLERPAGAASE
jgi:hypothetical protein